MKKIFFIIFLLSICFSSALNGEEPKAGEVLEAEITMPSVLSACSPEQGRNTLPIIWKGSSDKRSAKYVGVLKKGKKEFDVVAKEPVENLLAMGMKQMLAKCGYRISDSSTVKGIEVKVDLTEYFAGSKKGIIMGQTEANAAMTVRVKSPAKFYELEYTASKEDKGLKKKNIKKLESSLGEVMGMLIDKVASTKLFSESVKELSELNK